MCCEAVRHALVPRNWECKKNEGEHPGTEHEGCRLRTGCPDAKQASLAGKEAQIETLSELSKEQVSSVQI